jgi:DNA-directed RNA polymerase subunit RPC12/RpoP
MDKYKCPHCGIKLGNFMYAYDCLYCHEELKHNTRVLVSVTKEDLQKPKSWPVCLFFRLVRFVES